MEVKIPLTQAVPVRSYFISIAARIESSSPLLSEIRRGRPHRSKPGLFKVPGFFYISKTENAHLLLTS